MVDITKTFDEAGDFKACYAAETFLHDAGFSIGSMQRGDPRGIMFGDYSIAKWRNLDNHEREACHGQMTGQMREGPVTITIFETAPEDARAAFRHHELTTDSAA